MLYIIVNNDRQLKGHCSFCGAEIEDSFSGLDDLEPDALYCNTECCEAHIFAQLVAVKAPASEPKRIPIIRS